MNVGLLLFTIGNLSSTCDSTNEAVATGIGIQRKIKDVKGETESKKKPVNMLSGCLYNIIANYCYLSP